VDGRESQMLGKAILQSRLVRPTDNSEGNRERGGRRLGWLWGIKTNTATMSLCQCVLNIPYYYSIVTCNAVAKQDETYLGHTYIG